MTTPDLSFLPAYGLSGSPLRFDPGTLCVHSGLPHTEYRLFALKPNARKIGTPSPRMIVHG